ncbi:Flagellar biosynthetic protein flhB [Providencia rustigianii]|nr:Flagellar biosynthetic protein flhB [Providencia rustigianii]
MSDESDVEKTEEPTPHKKQKAKDDGQIVRSKELSSLMMMLAGVSLLWLSGGTLPHNYVKSCAKGLFLMVTTYRTQS